MEIGLGIECVGERTDMVLSPGGCMFPCVIF